MAYAQTRLAFGQPIGQQQLVKQLIAEQVSLLDSSRLLWWRSGWLKNQGLPNTRETSLAKWYATEGAVKAANNAIQVHGGYGYSNEYPVERFCPQRPRDDPLRGHESDPHPATGRLRPRLPLLQSPPLHPARLTSRGGNPRKKAVGRAQGSPHSVSEGLRVAR